MVINLTNIPGICSEYRWTVSRENHHSIDTLF